mgnify:CR=1 FL=1
MLFELFNNDNKNDKKSDIDILSDKIDSLVTALNNCIIQGRGVDDIDNSDED